MASNLILYEKYIRDQSIINNNVDYDILRPLIFLVQDMKLRPLLGSDLYNLIITQTTPPTSLSAPNGILVNQFILPMLHWYLVAECAITMKFRFMNKGIMEKSSDNSQQISTDDLKLIELRYESAAQNYAEDLRRYIIAHIVDYPAYNTNGTYDKIIPIKSAYASPWYIPGYRRGIKDYSNVNYPSDNPIWPD